MYFCLFVSHQRALTQIYRIWKIRVRLCVNNQQQFCRENVPHSASEHLITSSFTEWVHTGFFFILIRFPAIYIVGFVSLLSAYRDVLQ